MASGKFTKDSGAAARANVDEDKRREGMARASALQKRRAMITQQLISELNAVDPFTKMTNARLMVMRLVMLATAEQPDLAAIKEVYDRVEGKARQQVEVTHDGDVTVRSAAVSVLDELIAEATGRGPSSSRTDSLPN